MYYLKNVVSLSYDSEKCNGCGMCSKVCPHGVFLLQHKKAIITDRDMCMECGACAKNCSESAISVKAGVGCAAAIIMGAIKRTEPVCGCSGGAEVTGGAEKTKAASGCC